MKYIILSIVFFVFLKTCPAHCDNELSAYIVGNLNRQKILYTEINKDLCLALSQGVELPLQVFCDISRAVSTEKTLNNWYALHRSESGAFSCELKEAYDEKEEIRLISLANLAKMAKKNLLCSDFDDFKMILSKRIFDKIYINDWLLLAADAGRYEAVGLLVDHGADVSSTDFDGNTIFHLIAQTPYNKPIPLDILCPLVIDSDVLSQMNKKGETALSLIEQARDRKNWRQYFIALPMTYCLDKKYTEKEYSLIQHLLDQLQYQEETSDIATAIERVLPFANLRYKSKDKKTLLHFADAQTEIGQKIIHSAWEKLVLRERVIDIGTRETSTERKKKLMLEYLE